jgi:hypothetical protein
MQRPSKTLRSGSPSGHFLKVRPECPGGGGSGFE